MDEAFEKADFYATDDACEVLTHERVIDLFEDTIDDIEDDEWPITVYAYKRCEPPSDSHVLAQANSILESVEEWWGEDWGNPEELDTDAQSAAELRDAIAKDLQAWVAKQKVWSCEVVAQREFTREDAERACER